MSLIYKHPSNSKDRKLNNKSGFEPEDLMNFVDDVTSVEGISTDMDADNAILFTESALDFTLVNDEELPLEVHTIEIEYELYVYAESSGTLKVAASDIQDMYDDLYDLISDSATNHVFNNSSYDKIVTVVDLEWGTLAEGQNIISVTFPISNFSSITLSCPFSESWYPINDAGGCNGNSATSSDAAQQINWRVNNTSCNADIVKGPALLWYNIQSTFEIIAGGNGGWGQTYTTSVFGAILIFLIV